MVGASARATATTLLFDWLRRGRCFAPSGDHAAVLKGSQSREVVRVLVECCGSERAFNGYYAALARRLCAVDPQHRFTLQLCAWDGFKSMSETAPRRALNLAKFWAVLVAADILSLPTVRNFLLLFFVVKLWRSLAHWPGFDHSVSVFSAASSSRARKRSSPQRGHFSFSSRLEFFFFCGRVRSVR